MKSDPENVYIQEIVLNNQNEKHLMCPNILLYDSRITDDLRNHCGTFSPHPTQANLDTTFNIGMYIHLYNKGVTGGWSGWAIAYPVKGRIEGAAGQQRRAALLIAHPVFGSYLLPCIVRILIGNCRKI